MAFYELSKAKERLNYQTGDISDDTMLNDLGSQADDEVRNQIYIIANRYGKLQGLPAVDVSGGKIGGVNAPQSIKDAATNMLVGLYHLSKDKKELGQQYIGVSKDSIKSWIIQFDSEADVFSAWV